MHLSVVIITFNEAENIACCINSSRDVADEILVVDSFSTDNTKAIAESLGAKVLQQKFEGYAAQKNTANAKASHDWILSLDADEALSEELRNSIREAKRLPVADGYSMNRMNFYCGRTVKTCGWYPDAKIRLWNRSRGEWSADVVHEKVEMDSTAKVLHLQGDLLHYTYKTPDDLLRQTDKYATLAARQLKSKSALLLLAKLLFSPPFRFVRNYFFKLGFTDGAVGFAICRHQMREVWLKYLRALRFKFQNSAA